MAEYNVADANRFLLRSWLPLFLEYDTDKKDLYLEDGMGRFIRNL
jgi:hypothetical protein